MSLGLGGRRGGLANERGRAIEFSEDKNEREEEGGREAGLLEG